MAKSKRIGKAAVKGAGVTVSLPENWKGQKLSKGMRRALNSAMMKEGWTLAREMKTSVQEKLPFDLGALRSAVGAHAGFAKGGSVVSRVTIPDLPYAHATEFGFPIGTMPNPRKILASGWIHRKLNPRNDRHARSLAFLVARKMKERGTVPYRSISRTEEYFNAPRVTRIFNYAIEQAVKKFENNKV